MSAQSSTHHSFVYVTESEYLPVKNELIELIKQVQKAIEGTLKFSYKLKGSASRDMITKDTKGNTGYDFDFDILIGPSEKSDPQYLKNLLRNQFDRYVEQYGYDFCEDSTTVLTIKNKKNSQIIHSADFAIVRKYNGVKQVIINHKDKNTYTWDDSSKYSQKVSSMAKWCKKYNLWEEVKKRYLQKKNENTDENKKSRMIFADTVNEIYTIYQRKK